MTNFTKDELLEILYFIKHYQCCKYSSPEMLALEAKVENEIESHSGEEIFSCHTGLAVGDEFFCGKQSMGDEDLLPAVHQLMQQCEGLIRTSGIYAFYLRVVKMK